MTKRITKAESARIDATIAAASQDNLGDLRQTLTAMTHRHPKFDECVSKLVECGWNTNLKYCCARHVNLSHDESCPKVARR